MTNFVSTGRHEGGRVVEEKGITDPAQRKMLFARPG